MNILYLLPLTPETFTDIFRQKSKAMSQFSGFETTFCREVCQLGHQTTLIYLTSQHKSIYRFDHTGKFPVYLVPKITSLLFPNELSSQIFELISELHRRQPFDLIHIHSYYLALFAPLVFWCRRLGVPLVTQYHGGRLNLLNPASWIKYLPLRWVLGKVDLILIPTPSQEKTLTRYFSIPPHKIKTFPSGGVDLKTFFPQERQDVLTRLGLDPSKKYLLYVGRLHPQKGVNDLLRALGKVRQEFPDCSLLIVGGTPAEQVAVKSLIHQLNLGKEVVLTGFIPHKELNDYYAASECLILPSYSEGQPLVILEAWACQRPVVATQVGGVPYIIKDGKTGLLVPPKNPVRLAKKIERLLTDRKLCARLARDGYFRAVKDYSWEVVVSQVISLYQQVIKSYLQAKTARSKT